MNVIQRPRAHEFCATMQDYIIDTDATITFAVEYGGKKILEEEYVPDASSQVRVRRLGNFCEQALWGVWYAGELYWQEQAAGEFKFYINDVLDTTSEVIYSCLQTGKDAASPGVLSEVNRKVTRPGVPEFASGFIDADAYTLSGVTQDGIEKSVSVPATGGGSVPCTVDASYETACGLLGVDSLRSYSIAFRGGSIEFLVDISKYADIRVFRYKNVYDMPETLSCTGGLTVKGNNESTTSYTYGIERKYGLKITDEYTAVSGPIFLRAEYKCWHNLLNAREAAILTDSGWLPIVITGQKLERGFKRDTMAMVEFSFRLADPLQNNLIE